MLLLVDAVANLILGAILLSSPAGTLAALGMPRADASFYTTLLGAIILGIGAALLIELLGARSRIRGLGLGGAIAINLCGGGALLVWLIILPFALPLRGRVILWIVDIAVIGIAAAELISRSWKYEE